ncbi:MAG TPA: winged helix-turn-helix domain-containing protein [Candidatus Acidoferrales bacterium]|jgi:DNA-binding winged helix-turn-helix (wHTH) protein|nr:winged helix-turn-helix domain-containing protein [Candidatus Acidoferrales bacterium]
MWDSVRFGPFTFSRRRRELRRSGTIVRISNKALEALDLFLKSPGVTISKRDLYDALWGEKLVDESNLAQTIFCLRKALAGENGVSAIKTVPGIGYAFVDDVAVCPPDLGSMPVQALVAITPYTNPEAASLATARRLLQRGRHADARTFLEPMASKHLDASSSATFLSLRARARMDGGDEARAQDDVREAMRISKSFEGASAATALEAATAQAYLAYRKGHYPASIEIARRAVDAVPTRSMGPTEARLLAQALIELASQELELGATREALAHLARADAALRALPEPPAGDRCQILIQSALGYATSSSDFTRAIAYAREALQLAQWHQLDYEQVWADLTLAIIGQCADTLPEAQRHAQSALALAGLSLDGDQLGRAYFIASRIETALGNGSAALALLQQAWPIVRQDPLMRSIFYVCEARTRRVVGDERGTEIAASRALETIERDGSSPNAGIAYLARAWARRGSRMKEAIADVELAIECLRRGGFLADLAGSLQLSYEMTGNETQRREALEIARF